MVNQIVSSWGVMKTVIKVLAFVMLAALVAPEASFAGRLTLAQENLIGLPNRFAVKVSYFQPEGEFSPESVKALSEEKLASSGLTIVSELASSPLAIVNVNVQRVPGASGAADDYDVDVNLYNLTLLETKYKLRKGTLWKMGSFRVKPSLDFPKDVEEQVLRLLEYLVHDYAIANPGIGSVKEEPQG